MAITGNFDGIFDGKATGWAVDKADFNRPVLVQLFAGERMIAEALANQPRKDLEAAGVSSSNGGFAIPLGDAALDPDVELTVRVIPGGGALFGGPHKPPSSNRPAIYIDGFIQRNMLTGWIKDRSQPERTFTVQLFEDEELIGETSSDGLIDGQKGAGRFTFLLPMEILDGALHRFTFHCKELGWTFESRSFLTPRHDAVDEAIEYPFLDHSAWAHTRSAKASRAAAQVPPAAKSALTQQIATVETALSTALQTDKARIHDLLCQLGYLYLEAAQLTDAVSAFERAAALEIGGTKATIGLADTLRKQGKVRAAQAVLDKALKKNPESPELLECQDRIAQKKRADAARLIAFYLPQFHPTPENDEWWGKGFTEWTNVTSATPLFEGHLQPRRPTELGYYDLRLPEVANAQFDLARRFGIDAFCYYYYWFDGKRVLDRPLQDLIDGKTGPFPFCICWANEDWTRSWDGQSGEVLLAQNHSEESDFRFIQDLAPALKHPDYVRIDGKPVVLIYRAEKLSNAVKTTAAWRKWCIEQGIGDLHLCAVQSFGFDDPRPYGFDAAVEFPPHAVHEKYPDTTYHERLQRLPGLVERFTGSVFNYEVFADAFIHRPREPYRLYRGCFLAWDNTARRGKSAHVFHNFSVDKYIDWLSTSGARTAREGDNALTFVNAWNEWAEGAVLEPDATFGHALLEATRRAKSLIPYKTQQTFWKHGVPDLQLAPLAKLHRVILVGHDAHAHGAQINLLNMARSLKRDHGINVTILLLESGVLHQEYEKVGETILLDKETDWQTKLIVLARRFSSIGTCHAICNTVVTGEAAKILRTEGFRVVSLVHELPSLIEANGLQAECWHIAAHAHNIVFASSIVAREFNNRYWANDENILIAPQGIAFNGRLAKREHWRQQVRTELGPSDDTSIVMGCGYGDIRKGVDLFVQVAAEVSRQCAPAPVAFVWVGALEGTIDKYVRADVARLGLCDRFFITGRVTDADRYYAAADIFALTSREDPFPSVVMEAYDAGLPVVAFDGGGGYVDIINADTGALVPYLDVTAMAGAIAILLKDPKKLALVAKHVHEFCRANFSYKSYMAKLLALLKKTPAALVQQDMLDLSAARRGQRISVIVPNFNYGRYLDLRLRTIADQTVAPCEIIVLDDASTDDSVQVIERFAQRSAIPVTLVRNAQNTGNPFVQWAKGLELASGDFVWIAEADDYCEPTLLATLLERMDDPECVLAWSDSIMVNEDGGGHGAEYKAYYAKEFGPMWWQNFTMDGAELIGHALAFANVVPNASAALFRHSAVKDQLALIQEYRFSGDWWFWLSIAQQGRISYCSDALNYHRRHRNSVMGGVLKDGAKLLTETLSFYQRLATYKPEIMAPLIRLRIFKQLEALYRMFPELGAASARLKDSPAFAGMYSQLLHLLDPKAALESGRERSEAALLLSTDVLDSGTAQQTLVALQARYKLSYILIGESHNTDVLAKLVGAAADITTFSCSRSTGMIAADVESVIRRTLGGCGIVLSYGLSAQIAAAACVPDNANWTVLAGPECDDLLTQRLPTTSVERVRDAIARCNMLKLVASPAPHGVAQIAKSIRKPLLCFTLNSAHVSGPSEIENTKDAFAPIIRAGNMVSPEQWPSTARSLLAAHKKSTLQILVTENEGDAIRAHLNGMRGVELVWIYEKPCFEVPMTEARV